MNRLPFLLVAALSVCSCKISDKNLVFATNASFGVDLDSAPTTISFGYSRDELSVGPLTEQGEVLPVMASFSAGANFIDTLFAAGISQSFAIGNAAYILSKYFLNGENPGKGTGDDKVYFTDASASGVNGKRRPERCYVFGTTTTIGLRVGVSNANMLSIGVDSLSFGYKRKELAFAPITEEADSSSGNPSGVRQVVPPLIATLVGRANAGSGGTGLGAAQLYATGHAATYLAAEPGIRAAIGEPFIRDKEVQEGLERVSMAAIDKAVENVEANTDQTELRKQASKDAFELVGKASELGKLDEARAHLIEVGLGKEDGERLMLTGTPPAGTKLWSAQSPDEKVVSLKRHLVSGAGAGRLEQLRAFEAKLSATLDG